MTDTTTTKETTAIENLLPAMDKPVWGAEAIGRVAEMTAAQAFHALAAGLIDADKVGGRWVSTPRRVLRSIGCEPAS